MFPNNFAYRLSSQILAVGLCVLQGCMPTVPDNADPTPESGINSINVQPGFSFATTGDVNFRIKVLNNQDKPMPGVLLSVYGMPGDQLLVSGITGADGMLSLAHSVGKHITQVSVRTDFPGLPNSQTLTLNGSALEMTLGGSRPINYSGGREAASDTDSAGFVPFDYSNGEGSGSASGRLLALPTIATLGTWNSAGVPNYLTTSPDAIETQFYQDITASLPEGKPLTTSHPSYLFNSAPTTLSIKETADVWVTFVHEGAGWTNSLGFYTYDAQNPPQRVEDLQNLTLIFPNVSFANSGGGLVSGHKVKIGRFAPGTSIGFFMLANAFSGGKVGSGYYAHFSHSNLNVEKNSTLKRHVVLLDDSRSNRFLLAFEDVSRENTPINCDNDFNDAVFYVTSNPVTAIEPGNLPKMDTQKDSDSDGASDSIDEFPTDPTRAFSSYTPAKNTFGTLAYEDLWPSQGDYDFNDLVLNYNFQEILNAKNQVVEVRSRLVPRAIGASLHNGWGFELPVAPSAIRSVTGNRVTSKYISLGANRVETGGTKAVIMAFEDAFDCVQRTGTGLVNTIPGSATIRCDTLNVSFALNTPVSSSQWMSPPYNSFLVVNQDRGREVHLVNGLPTAKANLSIFGTAHDRSNPSAGSYYKNGRGLPWALNIPVSFDYPVERQELTGAYLEFRPWAESGGQQKPDWYINKAGYRNANQIYNK